MVPFRILLITLFVVLAAYTGLVIIDNGANLIPIFLGDIAQLNWSGQFNLDFFCFLVLSAIWLAWRHGFDASGWALAVCGLFGGALFLTVYLLYQSLKAEGDWAALLLGVHQTRA